MQYIGFFLLLMLALEIASLVLVVSWLGGLTAFILIVLSFFLGLFLMRGKGNLAKVLMGGEFLRGGLGQMSFYQLLWPVRLPLAGFLLMFPLGFLSSLCGLILLIPFKGKPMVSGQDHSSSSSAFGSFQFHQTHQTHARHDDDIIEGDFVVKDSGNSNSKKQDWIEHQK